MLFKLGRCRDGRLVSPYLLLTSNYDGGGGPSTNTLSSIAIVFSAFKPSQNNEVFNPTMKSRSTKAGTDLTLIPVHIRFTVKEIGWRTVAGLVITVTLMSRPPWSPCTVVHVGTGLSEQF